MLNRAEENRREIGKIYIECKMCTINFKTYIQREIERERDKNMENLLQSTLNLAARIPSTQRDNETNAASSICIMPNYPVSYSC